VADVQDNPAAMSAWRIKSDPKLIAGVRVGVEDFCRGRGMAAEDAGAVGLCVNEALANVIRHAYGGRADGDIVVEAEAVGDRVRVTVRDWGKGQAPSELPAEKADPLRPGGLGLVCLRKLMDRVQFVRQADGMVLKLEKAVRRGSVENATQRHRGTETDTEKRGMKGA
jgi:serine/threonine-protein kinase RsbW